MLSWLETVAIVAACRSTCHQSRAAISVRIAIKLSRNRVIAQPLQAQFTFSFAAAHQSGKHPATGIHPSAQLITCADQVTCLRFAQQCGRLESPGAYVIDETAQSGAGSRRQVRQVSIHCNQSNAEVLLQQRFTLRCATGLANHGGSCVAVTHRRDAYRIHVPDQLAPLEVADHAHRHRQGSSKQRFPYDVHFLHPGCRQSRIICRYLGISRTICSTIYSAVSMYATLVQSTVPAAPVAATNMAGDAFAAAIAVS